MTAACSSKQDSKIDSQETVLVLQGIYNTNAHTQKKQRERRKKLEQKTLKR